MTRSKRRTLIRQNAAGNLSARIQVADDDPTRDTNVESVEKFIAQALRRFKLAAEAEQYNRTQGLIDLEMVDGEGQWDSDVKAMRVRKRRPCLTINRFIPMISHVANEMRAARPGITIDPVGGGADPDSAEIRQGLIRHIEIDSGAETVYDNAFDAMLEKGWAWMRVVSDWEDEEAWQQALKIEGFENDFCVYVDPTAKEPTRKDMQWAFIVDDMPIGEYAQTYPDSHAASLTDFSSIGDDAADWLTSDHVRVAEYYYIDKEKATLVRLADGTGYWKDELAEVQGLFVNKQLFQMLQAGQITPEEVPIIDVARDDDGNVIERESFRKRVMWSKINAREILEGNKDKTEGYDFKSKYIPLVMVTGRSKFIRGTRRLSGMVRNNRDAQRMYNYWITAFTEMVALAPKSPFTAAAGQLEKYKAIWDTANEEAWPYLPYDPINVNGVLVPPPTRQVFEPPVQAMIAAIRQADNDLKVGFNIFDAALGQKGPQESGKAILARKSESESGNLNWLDNMKKSIQCVGDILLDLIPSRYDTARVISIVRPDNKREMVAINEEFKDEDGNPKMHDMQVGKYSCVVTIAPAHATKRQEAVESMLALINADPSLFKIMGDLLVENMDWPGAQAIVERLKKMLPPNLQDDKNNDGKVVVMQLQAKLDAMSMQHEMLVKALDEANDTLKNKKLEMASKEHIEALKAEIEVAKLESTASIEAFRGSLKRISDDITAIRKPGLVEESEKVTHRFNPETAAIEPVGAAQ